MVELIKYPSIENILKVDKFFAEHKGDIRIEEKIDGSNVAIRFEEGQLVLQSRTTIIDPKSAGMFHKFAQWAIANVDRLHEIPEHTVLYGEMVGNGKLRYADAPPFILFDVFYSRADIWGNPMRMGETLGIPYVKPLYEGPYQGIEHVQSLLPQSAYGNVLSEGVVVKGVGVTAWYPTKDEEGNVIGEMRYTAPMLAGKFVREDFKEAQAPKKNLASVEDPLYTIAEALITEARVNKAIQRAQEEGVYDPTKPHLLIGHVARDIHAEDSDYVKELLFSAYWKKLGGHFAKRVIDITNGGTI